MPAGDLDRVLDLDRDLDRVLDLDRDLDAVEFSPANAIHDRDLGSIAAYVLYEAPLLFTGYGV